MPGSARRILALIALGAVIVVLAQRWQEAQATARGEISPEMRAATLTFAPTVAESDRAWILAAIAEARPEAKTLIDEIDGLVEVRTDLGGGQAIGLAQMTESGAIINFDVRLLNGDRAIDRNVAVLHELGHIIDFVLVSDELVQQLDVGIPRLGACDDPGGQTGSCTAVEERFAETFAKWALRGRVSIAGDGYGIPTPSSLEDWGMPLGRLSAELIVRARSGS